MLSLACQQLSLFLFLQVCVGRGVWVCGSGTLGCYLYAPKIMQSNPVSPAGEIRADICNC